MIGMVSANRKKFGQRLRSLRDKRNLTQKELAKVFNLSESAIGMYERGEREPSLEVLEGFADYFEVSLDYLAGKVDYPKKTVLTPDLIDYLEKQDDLHIGGRPLDPDKKKIVLDFLKTVLLSNDKQESR